MLKQSETERIAAPNLSNISHRSLEEELHGYIKISVLVFSVSSCWVYFRCPLRTMWFLDVKCEQLDTITAWCHKIRCETS
jgi:hypothetical protein